MITSERTSRIELNHTPQEEVGIFVTRLWEHPLVDQQTRQHRQDGLERITDVMGKSYIQDAYFAVPFGSMHRGGVNEESDFDFFLFMHNKRGNERSITYVKSMGLQQKIDIKVIDIDDFMHGNPTHRFDHAFESANILFTPDEYVAGNTDLAQSLRLAVATSIQALAYPSSAWATITGIALNDRLKKSEEATDNNDPEYDHKFYDRKERLSKALYARSSQSQNPTLYEEKFLKARDILTPPSSRIYCQAMLKTNGAINIIPRYVAQGIK